MSRRTLKPTSRRSLSHRRTLVPKYAEVPDALPFFGGEGDDEPSIDRLMLERAFQSDPSDAEAMCGPVECTNRGCRPVSSGTGASNQAVKAQGNQRPLCDGFAGDQAEGCSSMRQLAHAAAMPETRTRSKGLAAFPLEFAEFADDVWCHTNVADKYYQTAVLRRPFDVDVLIKYAEFSWQKMQDKGQAESLFGKALEEEPENPSALASYALFLWESEAS